MYHEFDAPTILKIDVVLAEGEAGAGRSASDVMLYVIAYDITVSMVLCYIVYCIIICYIIVHYSIC